MNRMRLGCLICVFFILCLILKYLKNSRQEAMKNVDGKPINVVLYYANWCGYSKQFLPEWNKFVVYAKKNLPHINVEEIVCENGKEGLCKNRGVKGYPSVLMYKNNKTILFEGKRDAQALVQFCNNNTM